MEGSRFCSCQVLLLPLELSVGAYSSKSGKHQHGTAILTMTSGEFCPDGTFRSLEEEEKEEG